MSVIAKRTGINLNCISSWRRDITLTTHLRSSEYFSRDRILQSRRPKRPNVEAFIVRFVHDARRTKQAVSCAILSTALLESAQENLKEEI